MSRFRLSSLAKSDLAEIRHHIRRDKPLAADRQIAAFFQRFRTLARNPELGQRRPEFGPDLRVFSFGNYVIVYRPFANGVEIARVVSGYRDLDALFSPQ
ncbi:MAG: type II toxin-antitoxin system RelE/ParE family toxin [Planctomycetes bacterium]|nr:type II toxin-antitoxin system RelE/ParE family toxin [Planctomycetota bacterium]MCG2684283.1 type II toxin-antitoxin system RelE/ParE family toxin [Planctomycetales bacterium]